MTDQIGDERIDRHVDKYMVDNHISDPRARTFVAELRRFERSGNPTALAELFARDATLMRLDARGAREGAAEFWGEYRAQFHELSTTFTNIVEAADEFALEWTTSATLTDDRPIDYRGVTIIGFDGELIAALRTYYDTAVFTKAPSADVAR